MFLIKNFLHKIGHNIKVGWGVVSGLMKPKLNFLASSKQSLVKSHHSDNLIPKVKHDGGCIMLMVPWPLGAQLVLCIPAQWHWWTDSARSHGCAIFFSFYNNNFNGI